MLIKQYVISMRNFNGYALLFAALLTFLLVVLQQTYGQNQAGSLQLDLPAPLALTNVNTRYDLAGSEQSTRFFIPSPNANIAKYVQYKDTALVRATATNKPNFLQTQRYWFGIDVVNHTEEERWNLHISNFFIDSVVLVVSNNGVAKQYLVSDFSSNRHSVSVNPIGRSFSLRLEKNVPYTLALELNASKPMWPPYIGVMTEPHYEKWSSQLNYLYKIPIGIVLGIAIIGFICFFLLWDKTFLWFGVSSLLLLNFNLQHGSAQIELFDNSYEFSSWLWVQVSFTIVALLLFAFDFLRVNRQSRFLHQSFIAVITVSLVVLFSNFFLSDRVNTVIYSLNAALMIVLIFGSGIFKLLKGEKYYIIYLLGWSAVLYSILEFVVLILIDQQDMGVINVSYKIIRELYVQILHMLFHSIAIFLRVQTLKKQKLEAERASQAKSRFMAASSHDLRQPLHSMEIFMSSLKEHVNTPAAKEILDSLERSHAAMNMEFQSIMELNQLEAGVVSINRKIFPIETLFEKLRREYIPQSKAKGLKMTVIQSDLYIESDPLALERILRNLITNAIRYTSEGRVLVGCRRRGSFVAIQVWDTGYGIRDDELICMFDIYQRSSNAKSAVDGMGIGLSIAKQLSDLLNHKLNVVSLLGKGTVFGIEVPIACNKDRVLMQDDIEFTPGKLNMALVISEVSLHKASSELFTRWGYKPLWFSSISELNRTSRNIRAQLDLLIVDVDLINDEADVERLKEIVWHKSRCVVAAFVGSDASDKILNQLRNKDTQILYKPIQPSQMRALLSYTHLYHPRDDAG